MLWLGSDVFEKVASQAGACRPARIKGKPKQGQTRSDVRQGNGRGWQTCQGAGQWYAFIGGKWYGAGKCWELPRDSAGITLLNAYSPMR